MARCQFKWGVASLNKRDRDARLQDSARTLKFVVDELHEDKQLAEANFWLAKVHFGLRDFENAEKFYELAWSGGEKAGSGAKGVVQKWDGMSDPEFDAHNRASYIEDRATSLLQRGEELVLRHANKELSAEEEQEAVRVLGTADFWASKIKQDSRLKSAILKARALELQWRMRPTLANPKAGEIHPKLAEADRVLVEALKEPLADAERAMLLRCRAELLWDTDWRTGDIAQPVPTAIGDADKAASLAGDPDERAQALGIAGIARLETANERTRIAIENKTILEQRKPIRQLAEAAEKNLRDAITTARYHPKSWRWKAKLAEWLIADKRTSDKVLVRQMLNEARDTCPQTVRAGIDRLIQQAAAL
jgi:hypothetical protein